MKSSVQHDTAPEGVRHPPHLLWAAGWLSGAAAIVLIAAELVERVRPYAFDRALLLALRHPDNLAQPIGPVWLHHAMRDITALGGGTVLTLVVVIATGMLLVSRKWLTASLVAAGTVSGSIIVSIVKTTVDRARPDVVPHLVEVSTRSFPSGHSANSAIIYLTLAVLLTQIVSGRARRSYMFAVTALLVTAIGFSRIYLGVHWPSDVIAGWSFGTFWALGWWQIARWARRRQDSMAAMPVDEAIDD